MTETQPHVFVQNPLISFSSCQICLSPQDAPGHLTDSDPQPTVHPIDALRQMVADDIARTGPAESFMIRSGLLADLLDELAGYRSQETARSADVGENCPHQLLAHLALMDGCRDKTATEIADPSLETFTRVRVSVAVEAMRKFAALTAPPANPFLQGGSRG